MIDFIYTATYSISGVKPSGKPQTPSLKESSPPGDSKQWFKPFEKKPKKKSGERSLWASNPDDTTPSRDNCGPLATHARVFTLACKYFVTPLKYEAILNFKARMFRRGIQPENFAAAIRIAYGTTPGKRDRQMRDCIFGCIVSHLPEMVSEDVTRAAIDKVPGLSMQLLVKEKLDLYFQELTEPRFWSDDDESLSRGDDSSTNDEE
jgi:hypothetical protein